MIESFLDANMEEPQVIELPEGALVVYCCRCPGLDRPNEDALGVVWLDGRGLILIVADGCGGMADGASASRKAVEAISESLTRADTEERSVRPAILDGIEAANQAVQGLGSGAATTVVIASVLGDELRTYHVGDSQAIQVSNRGRVKQRTTSHSPVGYGVEAGLIAEEEAIHHEDLHYVSNVIGDKEARIEIGPRSKFAARDTLVLGSDGLFDNLSLQEIVNVTRKGPLGVAAAELALQARDRMQEPQPDDPSKPDDLTFALYRRAAGSKP